MRHKIITTISVSIFLITTSWSPPAWPISPEPINAEELFARSGLAYRAMPMVDISFSTTVEMPNAEPGRRVTHYLLGEVGEAVIEIGSIMRVVANATNIYAELPGHDDRYLAIEAGENLPSGLARLRGKSSMAGLWNPVPAALRDALGTAEILDAFRYSRHLGELSVAGFKHLPGPVYEVLLEAENGSCRARFDGATFFLQDLEYLVYPPDTPAGYTVRINGNFETQLIAYDKAMFQFEDSGRMAVDSLRQLSPMPPGISQPSGAVVSDQMLSSHLVQIEDLAASLKDKDVLLVGEDHLYEEPPLYLAELLNSLDDRPVSLLLEMPTDIQVEIDQYMEDGSESTLDGIFKGRVVLQLQDLLRWAQKK